MELTEKQRIKKSLKIHIDPSVTADYKTIASQIRPFDLIAFRGGDVISDLIEAMQKYELGTGTFSHVGMAVTSELLPSCLVDGKLFVLVPGKVYIMESTFTYNVPGFTESAPDVTTGKGFFGVQLRDLEQVIPIYITNEKTKVAWCSLIDNPWDSQSKEELSEKFQKVFDEFNHRFYEMDFLSLLAAMFPSLRLIRNMKDKLTRKLFKLLGKYHLSDSGWQFCSELVATIYQTFGILPENFDPKDVLPIDFFGYDNDGIPALVKTPIFINDY